MRADGHNAYTRAGIRRAVNGLHLPDIFGHNAYTRAGIRGYRTVKIYKKSSYKNYCEAGKQVLCKHINAF